MKFHDWLLKDLEKGLKLKFSLSDIWKTATTTTDFLIKSDDPHACRLESLLQV
jgi:hypothetical protein